MCALYACCGDEGTKDHVINTTTEHSVPPCADEATAPHSEGCLHLLLAMAWQSVAAVACFVRVLRWTAAIDRDMGVLFFTLMKLAKNVKVFLYIWLAFALGFGVAFATIMPKYGRDAHFWGKPLLLPFWALYDLPEVEDVMEHSFFLAPTLLWVYIFIVSILLVNLLIAMLTHTHESAAKQTGLWEYARIAIVDEFAGSVHPLPPPLNLLRVLWFAAEYAFGPLTDWVMKRVDHENAGYQRHDEEVPDSDNGRSQSRASNRSSSSMASSRRSVKAEGGRRISMTVLSEVNFAQTGQVWHEVQKQKDLLHSAFLVGPRGAQLEQEILSRYTDSQERERKEEHDQRA